MIDVVVLAAGSSTRFGSDKLVADVDGRPLLRVTIDTVVEHVDVDRVLVVVGPDHADRLAIARDSGARTVVAERAADGMRSSLVEGLGAVAGGSHGVVVVLGDDPIASRAVGEVLDRVGSGGGRLVAVRRRGGAPHPVYLPRASWPLAVRPGDDVDRGVRDLLRGSDVDWIEVSASSAFDVDVPADMIALRHALNN